MNINFICKDCGNNKIKEGLLSRSNVVSLNAKTVTNGSMLKVSFCSKCGVIQKMQVLDPDKIK
ncbi:hypothetical protein NX821_003199 (plasmid) [Clostridium septicum]|uniref:hypothetical protein n=1 Tax=Clostridium septicum TaxID=1504 RepID=UPI0008353693|nr:hypothetical protein [Clostridium septicum]